MGNSLFHKDSPEPPRPPTPFELIESEVSHLKRGSSTRHGPHAKTRTLPWLLVLAFCALAWLYTMDAVIHAWDKGEAIRAYLYLHNYGTGPLADRLAATGIFSREEIDVLNHRSGSFQGYYTSPDAAALKAQGIIDHMTAVQLLHDGKYEQLDRVGRVRYLLFIRPGVFVPTDWAFLDPTVTG